MSAAKESNFFQYPPRRCPVDTGILITWQFAGKKGTEYSYLLCPLCPIMVCPECGKKDHTPNADCGAYIQPVFAANQQMARLEYKLKKAEYDLDVWETMLKESDAIVEAENRYDNERECVIAGTKVVRYGNLNGIDYGRAQKNVKMAKENLQAYKDSLKKYTLENGLSSLSLERRETVYAEFIAQKKALSEVDIFEGFRSHG